MAESRRSSRRFGIELPLAVVAFWRTGSRAVGPARDPAGSMTTMTDDIARQVTVFGVLATPGAKTARFEAVETFIVSWTSCSPTTGSSSWMPVASASSMANRLPVTLATATPCRRLLVKALDENGKVELRCELFQDKVSEFSTLVEDARQSTLLLSACAQERLAVLDRRGSALRAEKTIDRLPADVRPCEPFVSSRGGRWQRFVPALAFSRVVRVSRDVAAKGSCVRACAASF